MVVNSVCSNAKVMLDIGVVDVYKRREKKTHIMCFCTKSINFACTCLNQSPPMQQTGTYNSPLSAKCVVAG
jgi:hypothetical protein